MRLTGLVAVFSLMVAPLAQAEGFETFNQSTLARFAALPTLGQGAVVPAGESVNSIGLDWTNEFVARSAPGETLFLDAESQRYAMRYRAGLAPVFGRAAEWSVEIPVLITGGGVMDAGIEGWHSTFGLPNANRSEFPQDRYRVRYVRNGVTRVDLMQDKTGLGDLRLGGALALAERWTLRTMLQLPTGDRDRLTGGHAGGALWVDYSLPLSESRRGALLLSGGVSGSATGGPLGDYQRPVVGVAGAVLILPIYGALDGLVQVNAHTPLYRDSELGVLSRAGVPLAVGLRLPYKKFVFELAVLEDPSVNVSPDFGFLFGVKVKQF